MNPTATIIYKLRLRPKEYHDTNLNFTGTTFVKDDYIPRLLFFFVLSQLVRSSLEPPLPLPTLIPPFPSAARNKNKPLYGIPSAYYIVAAIHNEADHVKCINGEIKDTPMIYKLQNEVIRTALKGVFKYDGAPIPYNALL